MPTRLHFCILVFILFTTLSFNGVAPHTEDLEKRHKVSTNDANFGLMKRSGSSGRVLEQQDNNNLDELEDTRAKPRVMGHGQFKNWRSQPSDVGEEDGIEGREIMFSKKIKLKPKGNSPRNRLGPVPAPKV
ncbi:hypothetical protein QVD17_16170 [Tagetes erecta]|uniref:Uncharacterized protein n=1 Tax=Tagetes erecta TaxID=13708 RepID=A0AAD8KQF8_TARER|nr:hypothetical protein QVD17_16170 [Tagetes erecta]